MRPQEASSTPIRLTAWQKKQAAMLYHFSSLEYLRGLHKMVSDLINGVVDPLLDMAKLQGRDQLLVSKVWGNRNTSQNWANHAWPFLKDLQASLSKDVALRAANRFRFTSVNECLRGIYEYSMDWATPGEERMVNLSLSTISTYAAPYDDTVGEYENRWTDFIFACNYPAFAGTNRDIPKFNVRPDRPSQTGQVPPQTGVYFCPDDPYAALQFAWTENGGTILREANTFNEIGLAALSTVGRKALWFDDGKMFEFATCSPYANEFREAVFLDGEPCPALAPAAVARSAFIKRPANWVLVEMVPGQFEELDALVEIEDGAAVIARRVAGGGQCLHEGFYFTPAEPNSRRFFKGGEYMPRPSSAYGNTYWQWDQNQNKVT